MSINFNWAQTYSPAECERGKYLPIDTASLTTFGYPPTGGRGKYAELVYVVGTASPAASSSTFVDTAVANTTYIASTTYYGGSATVLIPPANLKYLEIYNNSTNSCYVLPLSTDFTTVSSQGMIVGQYVFYSLTRTIPAITITLDNATKSADLRVIGHYIS